MPFLLMGVIAADVVSLWLKINDRRGGRPNWATSSDIWLLIIAPAKVPGHEGSI